MSASELKRFKEVEGELSQYKRMYAGLARDDFSIIGHRVSWELDRTAGKLPKTIVCDNGSEFTSKAMYFWAKAVRPPLERAYAREQDVFKLRRDSIRG